jgi:hypothetical protein
VGHLPVPEALNRACRSGGPFKPFFGLSRAVPASEEPTLVAKNATRMGHPPVPHPRAGSGRDWDFAGKQLP